MPTPLYLLAEAGSIVLLGFAIMLADRTGRPITWMTAKYAVFLIPIVALGLVVEEGVLARLEGRRAKALWAVLGGSVELEFRRPLAVYLVKAMSRTLFMLAFAWILGFFRPPTSARFTLNAFGLLYAFALVQEIIERRNPLAIVMKRRLSRPQTCARR